jgi:hypothetical protein
MVRGDRPPEVFVTNRFVKSYDRGTAIQFLAEGAVHDFIRRYVANSSQIGRLYQRVAGASHKVLEIEISGGCRMIAHWEPPRLTLLDIGGHEVVPLFDGSRAQELLANAVPAPKAFSLHGSDFFLPDRPGDTAPYGNDLSPEWLYFLDDDQDQLASALSESAEEILLSEAGHSIHYVIGGPGTGKTCILLNLLKRLHNREHFKARMALPRQVKEYIEHSLQISLEAVWVPSDSITSLEPSDPLDLLLIDDPSNVLALRHAFRLAERRLVRFVVAAFDPLQLAVSVSDDEFARLVRETGASVHELRLCYRQKANVGEQARQAAKVIAESTPYLDESKKRTFAKEHAKLTAVANDLHFTNPHGYLKVYPEAGVLEWRNEVRRITRTPGLLWGHAPSLLVVNLHPGMKTLPPACLQELNRFPAMYRVIGGGELSAVKGLEFQHVFLILDLATQSAVQSGFHGSGVRIYDSRRLLRIPFSRAKDSLVTFVWRNTVT